MDSAAIALDLPAQIDPEAPRLELVAFLLLSALAVWSFVFISTAQALVN